MPALTVNMTISYGDTAPDGAVLRRLPLTFSLSYTEQSEKIVQVDASSSNIPVYLDTVSSPKFLFVRSLEGDVTLRLSDGMVNTPVPTELTATSGWVLLAHPEGQSINELSITTPAIPATGARVHIIALE